VFDLSTRKETHIIAKGSAFGPSVYGNTIAWLEDYWDNGSFVKSEIFTYDLSTHKKAQITTSGAASTPFIYGNKIVYSDNRYGNGDANPDVYLYDLSTRKETRITTDGTGFDPRIYKNTIVWTESHDTGWGNIWMYDLSTHKKKQLSGSSYGEYYGPVIYGNIVAWNDIFSNVYVYDISTSKLKTIVANGTADDVEIYDNIIVWRDVRNGKPDLYVYDLSTSKESRITVSGAASRPAIYGNRIVYQDFRNSNGDWDKNDIYMATLTYPPAAAFTASPLSGKKPLTVRFTDKSTGSPTSWSWNFGDSSTSTARNPTHKYTKIGKYTVSFTVKNSASSSTKKISNYITVK
jgi:beta propeller repeat protein